MNTKSAVLSTGLGIAAIASAGQAANAQVYQDLRGQYLQFTGLANVNVALSAFGGFLTTSIQTSLSVGPGGSAPAQYLNFNNSGPADDSNLTGFFPLPSISVSGINIPLPTLTLSASFDRNGGTISMAAQAPTQTLPAISLNLENGAIQALASATFVNPNATFVGAAIPGTGLPNLVTITGTAPAPVRVNPFIELYTTGGVTDVGPINFNKFDIQFTSWTAAAIVGGPPVPGPDSLAIFLPGMVGSLLMVRRRRQSKAQRN